LRREIEVVLRRNQQGFTLVEVVVAFAIFALAAGAIYESLGGAVQRNLRSHDREGSLLAAESLLARLRASSPPWKAQDSGVLAGGWAWHIEVSPFDAAANERSAWQAFAVVVHVRSGETATQEVVLRSVELTRLVPP